MLLWSGGGEDLFGPVLNFFHSMAALRVTEAEYTLLTATALLCSGHTRNLCSQIIQSDVNSRHAIAHCLWLIHSVCLKGSQYRFYQGLKWLCGRAFQSRSTVGLFPYSSCLATWIFQFVIGYKHTETQLRFTVVNLCLFLCCLRPADRASLQAANCVEKMQELILDLLSRVCGAHAGAARGGPQRFGRLLGRLTELRTLHHNYLLLTRRQPGLWWRERTRNSGTPPRSSLWSFMFELKD